MSLIDCTAPPSPAWTAPAPDPLDENAAGRTTLAAEAADHVVYRGG